VPFELGRPLGVPNDADFQKRVLLAAFDLLAKDRFWSTIPKTCRKTGSNWMKTL
jgi:hypothetical protein